MKKTPQYTLIKIPIKELITQNFNVCIDRETEIKNEYLITQGDSILFDQIERLRGRPSSHIDELILVVAKKNPRQEKDLRHILKDGFTYNGIHYSRFGKSASQAKEGITAFVCDAFFDRLYRITQMDIEINECVISKYEAQRCLLFSSCTLIRGYMPNIVIIGEYEKTLHDCMIKYVVEREREFTDEKTGVKKTYKAKTVEQGPRDITISPFDGCGCHEYEFAQNVSSRLGLDYIAAGTQIRLPFIKGFSVYVPFRQIFREWGLEYITDIYGNRHNIEDIDCIWNISMFKGHKLFKDQYGNNAWHEYMKILKKYDLKLGISKYSHHIKNLSRYTRMNFQYLQCLDLWNPKYIDLYENKNFEGYNILDDKNDGRIISLARYTTGLFEKIIGGEKFYTYRFLGISDTDGHEPESRYLEAALTNDAMLRDPSVKQFIYRKLKKYIDDAKVGKIYCSGFYHTGVGDMIGYLQYAAGTKPTGCLAANELYSPNMDCGELVSFRSPLVDPSEVNRVKNARNDIIDKWFGCFNDQDIVMFNMYDLSAPQQGGADFDGDIFLLCDDPAVIQAKIEKNIVIDIEDKTTSLPKPYTADNITEYEIMTRDNRIGEITNAATSIENRYSSDPAVKAVYDEQTSILRVMQGHEIDFIKTGTRWQMNRGLRQYLKQLPYFLLLNYPSKLKTYNSLTEKNRRAAEDGEDSIRLNAYRSPSPMNELCDYICTWEKKSIIWDKSINDISDIRALVTDNSLDLTDRKTIRICRKYINQFAEELKRLLKRQNEEDRSKSSVFDSDPEAFVLLFKNRLLQEPGIDERTVADYVISVSYSSVSISKAFAWRAYGDRILKNLKDNSDPAKRVLIAEVPAHTPGSYEYLGKYYMIKECDDL